MAAVPISIRFDRRPEALVALVSGRLDSSAAQQFQDELTAALKTPSARLLLDLAEVAFIASAGLRVLLYVAKQQKAHDGTVELCAVAPDVLQVIRISGFDRFLPLHPTTGAALGFG